MRTVFLVIVLSLISNLLCANVQVNALFTNHMVLQREMNVPIWGMAKPGEKIKIKASWGESAKIIAKADSIWITKLKTPEAGGPYTITISGKNTITIEDVLIGEVWLCTGQSNMDFSMSRFLDDSREVKYQALVDYFRDEVATVNDPWIRHIEVKQTTSIYNKKHNFEGEWVSANKDDIGKITATGYFFAKELRKHINVPIGLVECSWGGSRIQPWISEETYMTDSMMKSYFNEDRAKINKIMAEYTLDNYEDTSFQAKHDAWVNGGKKTARPWPSVYPSVDKQVPASLYNGMLSAIMPYGIKGALWYQGESNSHFKEEEYEKYFVKLIQSWRTDWNQGDFSFYWAQLAGYNQPDQRSKDGWAMVNDHLRRALELPNTGMAVLHDIGEASDVHPHNKMDAGKRLALWALKNDYGVEITEVSGPLYKSIQTDGDKIEVEFSNVGEGLMSGCKVLLSDAVDTDAPLTWFEIAGEDGVWKRAQAKIIATNKVEVYNEGIKNPIIVRYAWTSNPDGANLYNKSGLPAAVFTSED